MQDLRPLLPSILSALDAVQPGAFGEPAHEARRAPPRRGWPARHLGRHQRLGLGDKRRLVRGHCDPTVNLYDWYVGVRGSRVEAIWPITARGAGY